MTDSIKPGAHLAHDSQAMRLTERKTAQPKEVSVCGTSFVIFPGVYDTSVDTELMAETVALRPDDSFFEIGCGSGAVSLLLAKRSRGGIATDINPAAVKNAKENAARMGIETVRFIVGDGCAGVDGQFAAVVCNPPYRDHPTVDVVERMYWDPGHSLTRTFFKEARKHLAPNGRLYFGWADFGDMQTDLPFQLAKEYGFTQVETHERPSHSGKYRFFVLVFE